MSAFIATLAAALGGNPLEEKILLAPSYRVGRQWLDQAARVSGGFVNVRASTSKRLLLDHAEPVLHRDGLRPAERPEKLRLLGLALARLARDRDHGGYFTSLPPSLALVETLLATLEELTAAGVSGMTALAKAISSKDKAEELAELARSYRAVMARERLAGPAEIAVAAMKGLAERSSPVPILVAPRAVTETFSALEWGFFSRWDEDRRIAVPDDPEPPTATLHFLTADTAANEARQALRIIQAASVPLDRVEIVCLDPATAVPALVAAGLEAFGGKPEDLPFTFNGGLPGSYARPVRLLAAWLEWLERDLPPEGLARLVESGLLGVPGSDEALAARLRKLPINGGPDDYRRVLASDGDDAWLVRTLTTILPRSRNGALELAHGSEVLRAAGELLRLGVDRDDKLDAYARLALAETIAAWRGLADWPGFDALAWLASLAREIRVMGLGPLPGRLHVSDLTAGGHSGRDWLFVIGMDDVRYPGPVRQDPVLLDRERPALSPHLIQSRHRRDRREKSLARLLGSAAGTVWLSYARHDAAGDRELFPAALYTRLAGSAVPERAVLRPDAAEQCLCRRDDWLHVVAAAPRNSLTAADLAPWHPGLAAGETADTARRSAEFTAYDGRVPEAGEDFRRNGWTVSPTDMELLAACPRDFFFKRVLGVKPPDRFVPTPGRWLDGNERGDLLHDLFQDFLGGLLREKIRVTPDNFGELLTRLAMLLKTAIDRRRQAKPPRDPLAFVREEEELIAAARIFLREEVLRQADAEPVCLEAALGGAKENVPPWYRIDPIELALPSGLVLRLKGRADRIDRLDGHGGLVIYDYKTGRSDKYSLSDPFRQGRTLQPYLYVLMAEQVLREAGREEPVRRFSYVFPMPRDEGREIAYTRDMLRDGMAVLEPLAGLLAAGNFPLTDQTADLDFTDYAALHGDAAEATTAARRKALGCAQLEEWAELRRMDA